MNEIPQIGQRYIWDGLSVVVKDIRTKHVDAVEHSDGSVSPPRTTYSVFIEYERDGNLFSFWTPWTKAGFLFSFRIPRTKAGFKKK